MVGQPVCLCCFRGKLCCEFWQWLTLSVKTICKGHLQVTPIVQFFSKMLMVKWCIFMKIVEWLIPALRTKLVYGQWILEHHANLNNFHVLAISLAAMDQKLLLFLFSEIQPHPCLVWHFFS